MTIIRVTLVVSIAISIFTGVFVIGTVCHVWSYGLDYINKEAKGCKWGVGFTGVQPTVCK